MHRFTTTGAASSLRGRDRQGQGPQEVLRGQDEGAPEEDRRAAETPGGVPGRYR